MKNVSDAEKELLAKYRAARDKEKAARIDRDKKKADYKSASTKMAAAAKKESDARAGAGEVRASGIRFFILLPFHFNYRILSQQRGVRSGGGVK